MRCVGRFPRIIHNKLKLHCPVVKFSFIDAHNEMLLKYIHDIEFVEQKYSSLNGQCIICKRENNLQKLDELEQCIPYHRDFIILSRILLLKR